MPDREKVIQAFRRCFCENTAVCPGCYQDGPGFGYECRKSLCRAVLALLKEQEPVKPEYGGDMEGEQISKQQYPEIGTWWYECGYCRTPIDYHDKFCRNCGKAVKWGE